MFSIAINYTIQKTEGGTAWIPPPLPQELALVSAEVLKA
jgi:hypothetical protein